MIRVGCANGDRGSSVLLCRPPPVPSLPPPCDGLYRDEPADMGEPTGDDIPAAAAAACRIIMASWWWCAAAAAAAGCDAAAAAAAKWPPKWPGAMGRLWIRWRASSLLCRAAAAAKLPLLL